MASLHFQGSPLRDSSLANGACPVPGLQVVQVHFPQPETWGSGPGEVRLYRTEHGAIVMALGPDAVKLRTFPPFLPDCDIILENGFTRAPQNEDSGWERVPPPLSSRVLDPSGSSRPPYRNLPGLAPLVLQIAALVTTVVRPMASPGTRSLLCREAIRAIFAPLVEHAPRGVPLRGPESWHVRA